MQAERDAARTDRNVNLVFDQMLWTAGPDTSPDYLNGYCEQLTGGRSKRCGRTAGWILSIQMMSTIACATPTVISS